ncbi:endo alpha-1,4 polygalactosaminidase [Filifactor villosus]|uniref:Endo alpha-1,4 polygalactosaminidase n=1 Tax=Filifactor villosus TaxID=29374 RepID=A0ABV9QMR1_9FIRM
MKIRTKQALLCLLCSLLCLCSCSAENQGQYGVFLGIDSQEISKLKGYDLVVIDALHFSTEDIEALHEKKQKVYSYLNIGSIEDFRPYYPQFEHLTLSDYEDWPEERWIDVSDKEWRTFIVDDLAKQISEKGVDGFFIDNTDVWYQYPKDEVYEALKDILSGLKEKYRLPIVINGGDNFVRRALEGGDYKGLIDAVNQETVFTSIDFDDRSFHPQDEEQTLYLTDYLALCKSKGLDVYLLEYGADSKTTRKIGEFCKEKGYVFYISPSLELDR